MQLGYQLKTKNGKKRLYPAKITCEMELCATATTTTKTATEEAQQMKN